MSVIEVKNLTKIYQVHQKEAGITGTFKSFFKRKYKKIKAVDNISFKISEGELVGFIGPNGAGKTTTLKMLSGLLHPTSGQIKINGFIPWERRPEFQQTFAFVSGQKNQLWWDLPAYETYLLNKEIYEISDYDFKKRIDYLSHMLAIGDLLKTPVKKLSLGQRMKAELVASLIHQPNILFLDEPTIGLDVVAQNNMREFIKSYNCQFKATIILTSHYMGDVEKLAQRVLIINKGKLLYDGKLSNIVAKFTKQKVISLTFEKEIEKETLHKFGKVIYHDRYSAKVEIERAQTAVTTGKILNSLPVSDLTVEEPPIEEIISLIFTESHV